jgi:hypothetical protein
VLWLYRIEPSSIADIVMAGEGPPSTPLQRKPGESWMPTFVGMTD